MNLKRVLITGTTPTGIAMGRELARLHPNIQFDVLTAENFDESSRNDFKYKDTQYPNITYITIRYFYIIKQTVTKDNLKSFYLNPGNFSLYEGLQEYITKNIRFYDFIISTLLAFQRWRWFQELKKTKVVFCPEMVCSDLEYNKLFAKQILVDAGIPTPEFTILNHETLIEEIEYLDLPAVVKCNVAYTGMGFATWVFRDRNYREVIPNVQKAALAYDKTALFYTERFISGAEISAHFLCNGREWVFMGAARDYKKIRDGDQGINTSGAGTYAPSEHWTPDIERQVFDYMDKLMPYLGMLGLEYRGVMYLGIMIDEDGTAQVVEINTRPGGPEYQTLLKIMDNSNLLENLYRSATGDSLLPVSFNNKSAVSVTIMNKQYSPSWKLEAQMPNMVNLPQDIELSKSSHLSGSNNTFGVLTTQADDREQAADKIYNYLRGIDCKDYFYRRDIGKLK